jgi:hypothetical protein
MIILYIILSILNGLFSVYVQRTVPRYKHNNSLKTCWFVSFPLNTIFFPICLIISIFNYKQIYIIVYRRIKRNFLKIKNKLI